jgi:hypothetical protein
MVGIMSAVGLTWLVLIVILILIGSNKGDI